ncbi:hypothetical protein PsorP6_008564 [Peronosclerospora sorghi]|uniref:Uncharacterized protein n=1 Tax=Peronosclerospora sorghi TaxID=230839 RepID=A0ACC0WAJ3_9STRA|nr:hypothetical protein PsorP6_008564 [Peronosclerospora sorghi]
MMISHEEDGHVYTVKVVDTVSRFRDKDWRSVWGVKVLMIHQDKRHLDKVAAKEFWRYLFAFIKAKLQ